jgi:hypothetical protein
MNSTADNTPPSDTNSWQEFNRNFWTGFAGAERFEDGAEPRHYEGATRDGQGFVAVWDRTGVSLYFNFNEDAETWGGAKWCFLPEGFTAAEAVRIAYVLPLLGENLTFEILDAMGFIFQEL